MDEGNRTRMLRWVEADDRRFLRVLDSALAGGARTAGSHLACQIGCTECCVGAFPITQLDARRLRRGLSSLRETDPARASAVLARAALRLAEHDTEGPCPALDPETGACDLYTARPVTCRTFGLPVRIGDDDLPPCRLCFTRATSAEIAAARVTIDPEGDEQALVQALSECGIADESTTVAEALLEVRQHTS
ncbi:MAG: YkgJ family cysteine cluster protein [Acidobacteriota bacterium]